MSTERAEADPLKAGGLKAQPEKSTARPSRDLPGPSIASPLLSLQASAGNRAVAELVARATSNGTVAGDAPGLVEEALAGTSEPLPAPIREQIEPQLGVDLSAVKVHRDEVAAASAKAVGASAYTSGQHVVFGAGQYAPHTQPGRRLIAHELTHTAQQARGAVHGVEAAPGLSVSEPGDAFEQSAETLADEMVAGHSRPPP